MRWSELAGKEIINVADATRLGRVEDADLVIGEDGSIASLIASGRGLGFRRAGVAIPWTQVVRVGPEAMLVAAVPEPTAGRTSRTGRGESRAARAASEGPDEARGIGERPLGPY